jgi:hypothetical protein
MKSKAYAELDVTSKKSNLDMLDNILGLKRSGFHKIGDLAKDSKILDYSEWIYNTETIEIYFAEEITD